MSQVGKHEHMPPTDEATCSTCRAFDARPLEMTYQGIPTGRVEDHGRCRRHAPREMDSRGFGKFPVMHKRESCFEHVPIEPPTDERPARTVPRYDHADDALALTKDNGHETRDARYDSTGPRG